MWPRLFLSSCAFALVASAQTGDEPPATHPLVWDAMEKTVVT